LEVDVLAPQLQAFGQPHAGAVEQLRKQEVFPVEPAEHSSQFILREHHRQPALNTGPSDFRHPRKLHLQNPAVEEDQRRQRLLVGGRRHSVVVGERLGIDDGATTSHDWPSALRWRQITNPQGPAS
jgi:hypothetical protein